MHEYLNAILKAKNVYQKQTGVSEISLKVMVHPRDYIALETEAIRNTTLFEMEGPMPIFGMKVEIREEIQEGKFIITEKGCHER